MNPKKFAKRWLPPALIERLRPLLKRGIYFSGRYPDWSSASIHASGYDSALILERVKQAMLKVSAGEAVFERDSVLFDEVIYSYPVLAGLLRAAAENEGHLSVLDFGGALGSSFYQCHKFLPVLPGLQWGVVEQPHFVQCGQAHFRTDQLDFFYTIKEGVEKIRPSVALLSSVLQYVPEPYDVLKELIECEIRYLIIDRTPFSDLDDDIITVQHVPASIYPASYPCRVFARNAFQKRLSEKYDVVTTFDGNSIDAANYADGSKFEFGGMILCKKQE